MFGGWSDYGPTAEFMPAQVETIKAYIDKNGREPAFSTHVDAASRFLVLWVLWDSPGYRTLLQAESRGQCLVRASQNVLTEQALPFAVLGRRSGRVRTTAVLRCRSNAVRLTRSKMAHQGLGTSHAQGLCCCIPVCRGGGLFCGLLGGFTTACRGLYCGL